MPVIEHSTHRPSRLFNSGHWQTIWPALWPPPAAPPPEPERIPTEDGDFLDLDWRRSGNRRVAVISHGLEGSSRAGYVRGMAAALLHAGWDVLAWSFRGCGRDPNLLPILYHSGKTDDLRQVIARAARDYSGLGLVGFSLGGNLTLKYLGEAPDAVEPGIAAAVTFSVPCDLEAAARRLAQPSNRLYNQRFLRSLRGKVREKARQFPERIDTRDLRRVRTFRAFDDRYTAPLHGFRDAVDYWKQCGSRQFLPAIHVPTLLVNARNDPFLAPECFPFREAEDNPAFYLETPPGGGHVGFASFPPRGPRWSERRAVEFLNTVKPDLKCERGEASGQE